MKSCLLLIFVCAVFAFGQNQADVLTTDAVIKMVQAGVPSQTIIRTIQSAERVNFTFLPSDLELLGRARVPEDVFKAMAAKSAGRPVPGTPVAEPAPVQREGTRPAPAQPRVPRLDADEYQGRGMWDLNFLGAVTIPHYSTSATTGFIQATGGYFVSRGSEIAVGVRGDFAQGAQNVALLGGYRYYFKTGNPRLLPFVGAAAGGNFLHVSGLTDSRFVADAAAGLRYFAARHVAIELAYDLEYIHVSGGSFSQSTVSTIAVGFAHTWGGNR